MIDRTLDARSFGRRVHEALVLSALDSEAKHGYGIARDVQTDSDGLFAFRFGTLYPILRRLEQSGLVRSEWSGEGRPRRVYTLTSPRRRHLRAEARIIRELAAGLLRQVGTDP